MNYGSADRQHQYLIGLDIGTSAVKGVLISTGGCVISREKDEIEYSKLNNGWIQFDAEQFYIRIATVIHSLVAAAPTNAAVKGLSMASASGNTLLIDDIGKPILPAISWMDNRVTNEVEQIFGELEEKNVHQLIGWPLNRTFPLAHLAWYKCHMSDVLESASRICMTTDYINYRLTGCWGIDPSTATTFYLQDQVNSYWHRPYLNKLNIAEEKLPPIMPSGSVLGKITEVASVDTGLSPGTPIILGAFDHPCAARGTGVFDERQMLISCGTSWVGFYPIKDRINAVNQKMLIDPFLRSEGEWGAMFSLSAIAKNIDKLICRHISDSPDRYSEFDRLSALAEPGAGGLFINPITEDFVMNADMFSKADIARAIMEGTAYLFKSKMDNLQESGISATSAVMVGGPSETFPWPQILCDTLGIQLSIINGSCAGAVGAAMLAGIGVGIYKDEKDAIKNTSFERRIREPNLAIHEDYKNFYHNFRKRYGI